MVTATFSGFQGFPNHLTRTVGTTFYFVSLGSGSSHGYTVSGYRWQEGSATIDRLYAKIAVPYTIVVSVQRPILGAGP
ncbi:MAG: hypothetical protein M3Y54_03555 [Bacteroidota bacterium]|nr:hypothetical protein [Bacteroidota bacterium]